MTEFGERVVGINGGGRMCKTLVRMLIAEKLFSVITINVGREVGESFTDFIDNLMYDSVYGRLNAFLYGMTSGEEVEITEKNEAEGSFVIAGIKIILLREHRNPKDIDWGVYSPEIIVDTSGQFNYPTRPVDFEKGSIRGHLTNSSVKKVLVSSPIKSDGGMEMPADAVTIVHGINDAMYESAIHKIFSNASCTTTCLAWILDPLVRIFGVESFLSIWMSTIHGITSKQVLLDRLPGRDVDDPVKYRSAIGNIFITTTGATNTLKLVMPEFANIPFKGGSVRVQTETGSLVDLLVTFKLDNAAYQNLTEDAVRKIYEEAAKNSPNGCLKYSPRKTVSRDIIGLSAATAIEGNKIEVIKIPGENIVQIKVFGWYDNEFGYVWMLLNNLKAILKTI